MQTTNYIQLERDSGNNSVAIVRFNREDKGNSFTQEMLEQFLDVLTEIEDNLSFRVAVLTSTGLHGGYGADLQELVIKDADGNYRNIDYASAFQFVMTGRKAAIQILKLRVPVIGLVKGYTLGGCAGFYCMCNVLYGTPGPVESGGMRFGFPDTTIGVMGGWMAPEILLRKVGVGCGSDLLLTGRLIEAEEAFQIGLIQKIVPLTELEVEGLKWARSVAENAPLAVESTRRTIWRVSFTGFEELALNTVHETTGNLLTQDFVKGVQKVLEKQKTLPIYQRK
jgi:enoyl-CoA hydratase